MSRTAWSLFLLFFPAGLGILGQVLGDHRLDHRLIALGLLLLCIDQARMALLDLEQVTAAQKRFQDSRLPQFRTTIISTIVVELLGFYLAALWLGGGIILVLLSQVWFNALATIQLQPNGTGIEVHHRTLADRLPILMADVFGVGLMSLWTADIATLAITLILWGMAIAYAGVKYVGSALQRN